MGENLRVVDLFAGCGGMSLGFQNAGFKITAAFDNWKPAIEVYSRNFKHPIKQLDLGSADSNEVIKNLKPDVIIGGPPCQDFSTAGHRNEKLGRADLTLSFARIISTSRPLFFVMENVPLITKSKTIEKALHVFKESGYGLTKIILDACYCGVPQKRKRFFLIGHLNSNDNFLEKSLKDHLATKPMSIHDYLGDSLGVEYYFRIPRSYSRRGVFSIHEPSVTIRAVERPVPKNYKRHPGDPAEIGTNARSLTILERSYIQTFPENFIFSGTKTDLNQMIGNAVPVKLAEFVAKALKEYISQTNINNDPC